MCDSETEQKKNSLMSREVFKQPARKTKSSANYCGGDVPVPSALHAYNTNTSITTARTSTEQACRMDTRMNNEKNSNPLGRRDRWRYY